jgi:hypothetical protein
MAFDQRKVTASILNIRDQPQIPSKIIGELKQGDIVAVTKTSGEWLWIQSANKSGWSFAKYLVPVENPDLPKLITYEITSNDDSILRPAAKISCNFWNRFIAPNMPIVMRLGLKTEDNDFTASSYEPVKVNGILYGEIKFNTKFLYQYSVEEAAATIIHELGHTLGFGWYDWLHLFDHETGKFRPEYTQSVKALGSMRAELDGQDGSRLSHWDEETTYSNELMTRMKNRVEYVLPVTIEVMKLLGHNVKEHLTEKTLLSTLIDEAKVQQFQRYEELLAIDTKYPKHQTEVLEHI